MNGTSTKLDGSFAAEPPQRDLRWAWLGRVPYAAARTLQETLRNRVNDGDLTAERLFLLEHEPVITVGRHGDKTHILTPVDELQRQGISVVDCDRGGDVTLHAPGQLVIYPVLRLRESVVEFLQTIADGLAVVCEQLGVSGAIWRTDPAGLWVGDKKIAACGLHLRRQVTSHGFAVNVTTAPNLWRHIVPCGLTNVAATSIAECSSVAPPPIDELACTVAEQICRALGRTPVRYEESTATVSM